jgi:hypothetical protein
VSRRSQLVTKGVGNKIIDIGHGSCAGVQGVEGRPKTVCALARV